MRRDTRRAHHNILRQPREGCLSTHNAAEELRDVLQWAEQAKGCATKGLIETRGTLQCSRRAEGRGTAGCETERHTSTWQESQGARHNVAGEHRERRGACCSRSERAKECNVMGEHRESRGACRNIVRGLREVTECSWRNKGLATIQQESQGTQPDARRAKRHDNILES